MTIIMENKHSMELSSQDIIKVSCELFSPIGNIYSRSQFGGYALCCKKIMFAIISDGELYLRSDKESEFIYSNKKLENFIYKKRGIPVILEYYKVTSYLWNNEAELLKLATKSFVTAEKEKLAFLQEKSFRIKELPNLTASIERGLWRAGITSVEQLKQHGAINAFILLQKQKKNCGEALLLALHGAIHGCHVIAISKEIKKELLDWLKNYNNKK